ncbi:MAG TPA: hypothetical protein VE379_03185, partial [Vicinamibacterales bacterium]|nr:hypothetical protein [Vicinamibacterales bacterium]
MRSVRVAVPVPGLDALTYRLPDTLPTPAIGARVLVPLGARVMTGVATGSVDDPAETRPASASINARGAPPPRALARGLPPSRKLRRTAVALAEAGRASLGPQALAASTIRDVVDVLDRESFLPEDVVRLALWVAEYYACGAGEALATAMPPRAWIESERHAQLTGAAIPAGERGVRRRILDTLNDGRPVRVDRLAKL